MHAPVNLSPNTNAHLWLAPFLARLGYHPEASQSYSNGRARIEIRGPVLYAHPGDGGRPWHTRLDVNEPVALCEALTHLLKTPGFQTRAELDRTEARREQADAALHYLGGLIAEAPDSTVARQLRCLLWSMFNGHHVVGLWRLKDALDARQQGAVSLLVIAWMQGHLTEDRLRQTLNDCGEFDRWDKVMLSGPDRHLLVDALNAVTQVLTTIPPGSPIPELARAHTLLEQAADNLRAAGRR